MTQLLRILACWSMLLILTPSGVAATNGEDRFAVVRLEHVSTEPLDEEHPYGTLHRQRFVIRATVLGKAEDFDGLTCETTTFIYAEEHRGRPWMSPPDQFYSPYIEEGEMFYCLARLSPEHGVLWSAHYSGFRLTPFTHQNAGLLATLIRDESGHDRVRSIGPRVACSFEDMEQLEAFSKRYSSDFSAIDADVLLEHACHPSVAVRLAVLHELSIRHDLNEVVTRLIPCDAIPVAEQMIDDVFLRIQKNWERSPRRDELIERWYEDATSVNELMQINVYFSDLTKSGVVSLDQTFRDATRALEMTHRYERYRGDSEKDSALRRVYWLFTPLFEDARYGPKAFDLLLDELAARRAAEDPDASFPYQGGSSLSVDLTVQLELDKQWMSVEQRRMFDAIRVDSRAVDERVASDREWRESLSQSEARRREAEAKRAETQRLLDARHGIETLPVSESLLHIPAGQAEAWVALVRGATAERAAAMLVDEDPALRSIGVWLCVLQRRYDLLSSNRQLMDDAGIGLRAPSVGVVGTGPSEFTVGELYRDQYIRKVLGHWDASRITREELDALYPGPIDHDRSVDAWSRRLRTAGALAGRSSEFEGVLDAEFAMLGNAPEDVRRAVLLIARMSGSFPSRTAEIDGVLERMRDRGGEFELSDPVSAGKGFHFRKTFERWVAQRDGVRSGS